jgi:hypothetical protein
VSRLELLPCTQRSFFREEFDDTFLNIALLDIVGYIVFCFEVYLKETVSLKLSKRRYYSFVESGNVCLGNLTCPSKEERAPAV